MKSNEISWRPMKIHEDPWNHMKSHEISWNMFSLFFLVFFLYLFAFFCFLVVICSFLNFICFLSICKFFKPYGLDSPNQITPSKKSLWWVCCICFVFGFVCFLFCLFVIILFLYFVCFLFISIFFKLKPYGLDSPHQIMFFQTKGWIAPNKK